MTLEPSRQYPTLSPSSKCLCHTGGPQGLRTGVRRSFSFKGLCTWTVAKTTKNSLCLGKEQHRLLCGQTRHIHWGCSLCRAHWRATSRDWNLFWKCHSELSHKVFIGLLGHQGWVPFFPGSSVSLPPFFLSLAHRRSGRHQSSGQTQDALLHFWLWSLRWSLNLCLTSPVSCSLSE